MARRASTTSGVFIDIADLSGLWWRPRDQRPAIDRLRGLSGHSARPRRYASGAIVDDVSGTECRMLIVEDGVLSVVHFATSGNEVVLAVLTAGHCFCPCDLETLPGCAVVALTDATCTVLEKGNVQAMAASLGEERTAFVRVMRDGLFFACLLPARDKVWRLLSFAQTLARGRESGSDGVACVPFRLVCTHRQLATLVNVAPETLCRQLLAFQREGLIQRRGPWISLSDAAGPVSDTRPVP